MVSSVVSIGDKIDLTRLKNSFGEVSKPRQYASRMLDFLEDDKLKIAMPIENSRLIPLDIGEQYQLCFFTNKGMYYCTAEVIDRFQDENISVLVVQCTSNLEKFQRRQYYRLEFILEMEYRVVHMEELNYEERLKHNDFQDEEEQELCYQQLEELSYEWYPAVITDISGGGARFNSTQIHDKGDKLRIRLNLPTVNGQKQYELKANVITSIPVLNKLGYFENRVEFSEIELEERETIIKFVFEEERKIRKREKGLL